MAPEQKIDRIDNNVFMLIDQVGRMTEGISELRLVVTDGFTEIKESMTRMESNLTKMDENLEKLRQVTEEQAKTSAEQTANITRLALIAESQAATADHLAKLVSQFLRDKQER
jgi:methyl-accepting chemotaxis protein